MTITKLRHKRQYTPPEIGIEDIEGVIMQHASAVMEGEDFTYDPTDTPQPPPTVDPFKPSSSSKISNSDLDGSFPEIEGLY